MKKNNYKVSLIVPCYKVEKYLPRCLDTLMNQTLDGVEAICINDGSPDNCLNILKEYKKKYKDKLVIIDKKNEGVWKGRKDGIKIARGKYIGFVDSDDYVALDYAEKLYNAVEKNNADISVCGFDRIDLETGKLYSREMCKFKHKSFNIQRNPGLLLEINTSPWNKIYKAELLKNMDELKNIPKVLDDMMFLQLIYLNAKKIVFINDSLYFYIVRKDSIINTVKKELIPGVYEAMKEVKDIYKRKNPKMLEYIDANAFLHLGISFMYRLSEDKELNFNSILKNNTQFLNNEFSSWKSNKYLKHNYVRNNNGSNKKVWIVRQIYRLHIFKLFLKTYKFMINHFGVDIKW